MSARITIALDAMGGDHAPDMVVQGRQHRAAALSRTSQFLLFGDESRIAPLLAKLPRLAAASTIHHTDEVVTGDAKPSVGAAHRAALDHAARDRRGGRGRGAIASSRPAIPAR